MSHRDDLFTDLYNAKNPAKFLTALGAVLADAAASWDAPVATRPSGSGTAQTGAAFLEYAREGKNIWGEPWVDADTLAARKASLPATLAAYPDKPADLVEALHLIGLDGDLPYIAVSSLDQYVQINITNPGKPSGGK